MTPQSREVTAAKQKARRERYRGTCVDCGARTDGSSGYNAPTRCKVCAPRLRLTWDRETIIAAIQLYAARYGSPPGAADFSPAMARGNGRDDWAERFYRDGDYPTTTTVVTRFGSWSAAIEAAGFTPRLVGHRGPDRPYLCEDAGMA